MPNFKWSSKGPGALEAGIPGRKFRVAAFLVIVPALWFAAGPIGLALSSVAVALIAPEVVGLWYWLIGKAEEHAVDRDERIYRFGYTDVRMLMVGENPWFAAADVGSALGFADIDQETKRFDVTKCDFVSGKLYLSEAGVMTLIGHSRHPDTRSFKVWFEREVMFPLNRAREARERERKAGHARP
jgi:hypothetical protein